MVLDWCPMGARDADDPNMAAAIRITAATLLITAESNVVVTRMTFWPKEA